MFPGGVVERIIVSSVLIISILLQFTAAFLALRLIRFTGKRTAWVFIAAAVFLMGVRRSITLYRLFSGDHSHPPDLSAEVVALAISVFMVAGVGWLAPLFLSIRRSSEALRKSAEALKTRLVEQEGLVSALEQVTSDVEVEAVIESVLGESTRVMGTDRCAVMLPDAKGDAGLSRQQAEDGPVDIQGEIFNCMNRLYYLNSYTY